MAARGLRKGDLKPQGGTARTTREGSCSLLSQCFFMAGDLCVGGESVGVGWF